MVNAPSVGPQSARPRPGPPEELFWKRYSPHGELPLSGAGSFALHALVVGLLVLAGFLGVWFTRPSRTLPVDAVQVAGGGGGGRPTGVEGGKGPLHGAEVAGGQNQQQPGDPNAPPQPSLVRPEKQPPAIQFKDSRVISMSPEAMKALQGLSAASQSQRTDGRPAARGTVGPPGGPRGPKPAGPPRTKQQERMLRWTMLFNTRTGEDYVRQLRGLGAILAVPVKEGKGQPPEYRLVRNLSQRPAQLLDEDLSQIRRIYWMDSNPRSVREVMNALGLQLQPSHFVAFMPEELEKKLLQLEKAYRDREENQIEETKFRIVEKNGRFEPEVIEQTPKR